MNEYKAPGLFFSLCVFIRLIPMSWTPSTHRVSIKLLSVLLLTPPVFLRKGGVCLLRPISLSVLSSCWRMDNNGQEIHFQIRGIHCANPINYVWKDDESRSVE